MTLTPAEFEREVGRIVEAAQAAVADYRDLDLLAYGSRGRRGRGGGGLAEDRRPTEEAAVVDASRQEWKERMAEASAMVVQARRLLTRMAGRVRVTYRWRDVLGLVNPPGGSGVTRAELERLMARQRRRREEGGMESS